MGRFSSHIVLVLWPRPTCKDASAHDHAYVYIDTCLMDEAGRHSALESETSTVSRMAIPMDISAFGFMAPCIT